MEEKTTNQKNSNSQTLAPLRGVRKPELRFLLRERGDLRTRAKTLVSHNPQRRGGLQSESVWYRSAGEVTTQRWHSAAAALNPPLITVSPSCARPQRRPRLPRPLVDENQNTETTTQKEHQKTPNMQEANRTRRFCGCEWESGHCWATLIDLKPGTLLSGSARHGWDRRQRPTSVQADASVRARAADSRTGPGWVSESCSVCQTTSECFPDSPPAAGGLKDSFAFSVTFVVSCLISPFPSSASDECEMTKREICCK